MTITAPVAPAALMTSSGALIIKHEPNIGIKRSVEVRRLDPSDGSEVYALTPSSAAVRTELGLMHESMAGDLLVTAAQSGGAWLLRVEARDDGGVAALKQAWAKDKFNVRVYNTLDILFEKRIASDYVTVKGPVFNIRYHKDEKDILERYVPRMLEEAWGSMVQRYGFTPKTPVSIELYADTEHFSVRTSGQRMQPVCKNVDTVSVRLCHRCT